MDKRFTMPPGVRTRGKQCGRKHRDARAKQAPRQPKYGDGRGDARRNAQSDVGRIRIFRHGSHQPCRADVEGYPASAAVANLRSLRV